MLLNLTRFLNYSSFLAHPQGVFNEDVDLTRELRRQAFFISLFFGDGLWELVVISGLEEALVVDDQAIILNSNYSIIIYECILFTRHYLMALRIV